MSEGSAARGATEKKDMTPTPKEKDEGRDAEDKGAHKGDWGSHSHADHVAEAQEPTQEQLDNAQAVINQLWTVDTSA